MQISLRGVNFEVVADWPRAQDFWRRVGEWEVETFVALDEHVKPGTVYVDIGAWIGPTVLYAAARGATVHCYEPDPVALGQLRANLAANPSLAERVTVHPVGLSTEDGEATMVAPYELGDSMTSLVQGGARHAVTVPVVDIANEVRAEHFQQCDVLKMDIEGGEYQLLPRMLPYLEDRRPAFILSTHPERFARRLGSLPRVIRFPLRLPRALIAQRQAARLSFYRWHVRDAGTWKETDRAAILRSLARCRGDEFLLLPPAFSEASGQRG